MVLIKKVQNKSASSDRWNDFAPRNFFELKNTKNVCGFRSLNLREWTKKYFRNHVYGCRYGSHRYGSPLQINRYRFFILEVFNVCKAYLFPKGPFLCSNYLQIAFFIRKDHEKSYIIMTIQSQDIFPKH